RARGRQGGKGARPGARARQLPRRRASARGAGGGGGDPPEGRLRLPRPRARRSGAPRDGGARVGAVHRGGAGPPGGPLRRGFDRHRMEVVAAETGREAIRRLETIPNVDIVLMDIMMPDMDGYDTMRAIRKIPRFKALPIIAVTAKAMKGDREKTLEAGAWD